MHASYIKLNAYYCSFVLIKLHLIGTPRDVNRDIIGILNRYDIILLSLEIRDYTTQHFVRILLPIEGLCERK